MCMNCTHIVLRSGTYSSSRVREQGQTTLLSCAVKTLETTACLLHWPPTHLMSNSVRVETERFIAD